MPRRLRRWRSTVTPLNRYSVTPLYRYTVTPPQVAFYRNRRRVLRKKWGVADSVFKQRQLSGNALDYWETDTAMWRTINVSRWRRRNVT